jgi:hypothetical protein
MQFVDGLPPAFRVLVREYGMKIVNDMVAEGYHDPFELQQLLETWRERRQADLLTQNHITERVIEGFRAGLKRMR